MSDIDELQGRIAAALDRIGAGVESLGAQGGGGDATALEEEKQANAQLEQRLEALKAKHAEEMDAQKSALDNSAENSAEIERLSAEAATQSQAMARLDMDVQRLRQANDLLRDSNTALREANEKGVGEPHLINKAMLAELEGLRAARATATAEVSAVLAKLTPLLAQAGNLVEGEDA